MSKPETSSTANRQDILNDFQACTGIEDAGEAFNILEETNWDLLLAINQVLPQDSQQLPSERPVVTISNLNSSSAASNNRTFPIANIANIANIIEPEEPVKISKIKPTIEPSFRQTSSSTQASSTVDLNKKFSEKMIDLTGEDGSETSSVEDMTESFPLEEDYFVPDTSNNRQQRHLIPDNISSETIGAIQFSENFSNRYGACHPMFLQGTLEEAVREACLCPAKNRKPLAIYLHHDGSVMSNVFCQQILCSESIVSYMTNNFFIWGFDVTFEANRQMLLNSVGRNFGTSGISAIRTIEKERYPVIIVISRTRSSTEISSILNSTVSVDELMSSLIQSYEMFRTQQMNDIREEEEREARELVKREQDEAYEASLLADRAKDEAKKAAEMQKKKEEEFKQEEKARIEAERKQVAKSLPPEPGNDCTEPICTLKCRFPNGLTISRKFVKSSTLKVLFDFLFSEGYSKSQFKFLTNFPKRDLTTLDENASMNAVFSAQETLIIEER